MWFAVSTRSRCEKAVQRNLEKKGIAHYLPLLSKKRTYGSSQRKVDLPLIPGYIFVFITHQDYLHVLQTDNVIGFVRFGAEINPIPQAEIDLLETLCNDNIHDIIAGKPNYRGGDAVEVISGPLKGVKGNLITVQGRHNLVVELKNIGNSLQVVHMESRHVRRLKRIRILDF